MNIEILPFLVTYFTHFSLLKSIFIICFCVCDCICVYMVGYTHLSQYECRHQRTPVGVILSYHMGSLDKIYVVRLGGQHLCLLSHPFAPFLSFAFFLTLSLR